LKYWDINTNLLIMVRNMSYALAGATLITGLLFKYLHWAGTGAILLLSLVGIIGVLIDYAIRKRPTRIIARTTIYALLGSGFVLGIMFKVMSWPYANPILIVSMVGLSFAFAEFAYKMRKASYAFIPALSGILMLLALGKIMHWPLPLPPYAIDVCVIVLSIYTPIVLLINNKEVKKAVPVLGRLIIAIASLSFITDVMNYAIIFYPDTMKPSRYIASIVFILLLATMLLVIKRALSTKGVQSQLPSEHNLLKFLGITGLITCLLQVLVAH